MTTLLGHELLEGKIQQLSLIDVATPDSPQSPPTTLVVTVPNNIRLEAAVFHPAPVRDQEHCQFVTPPAAIGKFPSFNQTCCTSVK
jgi:hypothetical protein